MNLLSVIWHYWIGVALAIPAVLMVVAIVIGYLYKVVFPRFPQDQHLQEQYPQEQE